MRGPRDTATVGGSPAVDLHVAVLVSVYRLEAVQGEKDMNAYCKTR